MIYYQNMVNLEVKFVLMNKKEAKARIEALRNELNRHNHNYYVLNNPTISDYEFDILMRDLAQLEKLYPEFIIPDSPTQKVGSDLETPAEAKQEKSNNSEVPDGKNHFRQFPHKHPMLSLANTYNIEELKEFDQRIRKFTDQPYSYSCELKFDGTGINLYYKDGALERALTRGDGTVGDDVTENTKHIPSIPQHLRPGSGYPAEFEIRGEIYMPYEAFDKLNYERELNEEQEFANPRNAAAGSLKLIEPSQVSGRCLECILYHLIAEEFDVPTHTKAIECAASWGLPTSEYAKECSNIEEVTEYIQSWDEKRKTLPFPTDGMVVKVNQFALQKGLGYTAKIPRWAVAYKFKPEQALTQLISIDYQVGRTGAVTPVANLRPVQLSGTVVKRATLHNADQMKLLDIHYGDYVYVEKGGEIIPKITGVELSKRAVNAQPAIFPSVCPVCGTSLVRDEDEAKFFCPNSDNCTPQIEGKFIHFIGRKALNINAGEATIHQLFTKGYIKELEDLYNLTDFQLLSLDKWKEKSVANFKTSLEKSKSVPFGKVLFGLGIRFIGETTAKSLAARFKSIEGLKNATREELLETEDVGKALADSIIGYFKEPRHLNTIEKLKEAGLQLEIGASDTKVVSNVLQGKTIMITGNYSVPRETMKQYIEAHGGKVGSSVTGNTSYLVAGEKAGDAKLKKAEKLGIPVISEEDFYKIAASEKGADIGKPNGENEKDETLF
ncbi:MAG: NAD-dependent DNA ligase LigA [Bacteroidales bacterium]|nr:NAD-dependent DNA ligase LigA [Bacteroidales bacterium]